MAVEQVNTIRPTRQEYSGWKQSLYDFNGGYFSEHEDCGNRYYAWPVQGYSAEYDD